jgi:hypothetical protein
MKRIKAFAVIAVLALIPVNGLGSLSHAASTPDEQYSVDTGPSTSGQELLGLSIADDSSTLTNPSWLLGKPRQSTSSSDMLLCSSISDTICSTSPTVSYRATIPVCTENIITNCIVSISAISPSDNEVQGKVIRQVPANGWTDFPGDPNISLPTGSSPTLFTLAGVPNSSGTETYLVNVQLIGERTNGASKFTLRTLNANISPVAIQNGSYMRMRAMDSSTTDPNCAALNIRCGLGVDGHSQSSTLPCASVEDGACALKAGFSNGYRFKLVVNLSDTPVGWFHGRLKNPDVALNPFNNQYQLSVSAEPVTVPVIGLELPRFSLPTDIQTYYQNKYFPNAWSWGELGPHGLRNVLSRPDPASANAFAEFALWAPLIKDKASASPSEWSIYTLAPNQDTSSCLRNTQQLIGVVTTNSMIYSAGPPSFNSTEGTLNYKVASPHYSSSGEVFQGSYDLQVRSEVARCLYNFTSAPVKASITVTSESGAESIASTTINETNGWLKMAAYGFTFSNPTITVKLSQDAPIPAPAPSASPNVEAIPAPSASPLAATSTPKPSPVTQMKKTITCIKGKVTRIVTAVNSTCPAGYKKK